MTAAPPPSGAGPDAGCDAQDLLFVHDSFRRLYQLMPIGVRGTPGTDARRVRRVADNVALVEDALHHHHLLEDRMFWDDLEARRPACAMHVDLMKRQHAEVAVRLGATPALLQEWQAAPSPATADALARHLEATGALLRDHLSREERDVLPVLEQVFTQAEWDAIGGEAQKGYAKSQIFLFFGLIQDSLEPEQAAELLADVPLLIRVLYRVIGRRQYQARLDLLSAGTAAPGRYRARDDEPAA